MDKLIELFTQVAEKFAPPVIDAAKQAVVVEAYSQIASSAALLTFSGALLILAHVAAKKHAEEKAREYACRDAGEGWYAIRLLALGAALLFACPLIWNLVDPWTWTAISHPELYIAKRYLLP